MTLNYAILLGIIQGLTEFLPVSSSGHLVIFQNLLGLKEPQLLLDVILHLGTLTAVLIYFKKEIAIIFLELIGLFKKLSSREPTLPYKDSQKILWWLIVGSVPTAIIGLLFQDTFESMFASLLTVGFMLMLTGLVLTITYFIPKNYTSKERLNHPIALAVGAVQGLAIIPGISRSGSTIACGLFCGLDRELAGRFSFLLSIPAIIGALILQLKDNPVASVGIMPLIGGFVSSFVMGFICLKLLMHVVKRGHLAYFAPYCFALGLAVILLQ